MDRALLESLIDLMADQPIVELEYEKGDLRIRLAKAAGLASAAAEQGGLQRRSPAEVASATSPHASAPAPAATIAAGLFGVFYLAPSPGAAPYVEEGDVVEEGQVLAMLEAMKMLNAVEAARRCRIGKILRRDGDSVQTGEPLFEVEYLDA